MVTLLGSDPGPFSNSCLEEEFGVPRPRSVAIAGREQNYSAFCLSILMPLDGSMDPSNRCKLEKQDRFCSICRLFPGHLRFFVAARAASGTPESFDLGKR
jgi:hypothetical protein